jgi:transposase-like protein
MSRTSAVEMKSTSRCGKVETLQVTLSMHPCPHCKSHHIKKHGQFFRHHTRTWIKRSYCKTCHKTFSSRTQAPDRYQKKTKLNEIIARMLCEKNSMRGISRILKISFSTVYRKFLYLSDLNSKPLVLSTGSSIWIDEMEDIEHTKLKPCTIAIAVDSNYKILAATVGTLPAKGLIARISRKKYGLRANQSELTMKKLMRTLKGTSKPQVMICDKKSSYPRIFKEAFPDITVHTYQGKRNQELENKYLAKKEFDPLFAVNQKSADLRDKINRLNRKSFCTTKKLENLQRHLNLRVAYENNRLAI